MLPSRAESSVSHADPLFVRGESVLATRSVSAAVGGHHSVGGLKCPWDGRTIHRFVLGQVLCRLCVAILCTVLSHKKLHLHVVFWA